MTEPTKLQLMTTEQLINELLDRFEHIVIVGRKTDDDCQNLDCDIVEEWQGDSSR
jgi:protocatechuate 3,4-dioxygenase beta subunit